MRHQIIDGVTIYKPTLEDVQSLQVGDLVPDCFNRLKPVSRIYHRGTDINGKAYVLFYTQQGENSQMSGDLKEDEIVITLAFTGRWGRCEDVPWVD